MGDHATAHREPLSVTKWRLETIGARPDFGKVRVTRTRLSAGRLSDILTQTADALERTADLADKHAERRAQAGRGRDAADERQAAQRAREATQHARSEAEKWRRMGESSNQ